MSANSKIEWTDASWNPIRARNLKTGKIGWHCEHASEGCRNCYAETMNRRLGTGLDFKPGHRPDIEIFLDEKMLLEPLRWKKPRMIFVGSMTDLFADFVKDEWIDRVFAVMALCPQHTFQVLTKRAERMRAYCTTIDVAARIVLASPSIPQVGREVMIFNAIWPLPNVWLGVSAEDQARADERIPLLLQMPAARRFVSLEPLLGPIDLAQLGDHTMTINAFTGEASHLLGMRDRTAGALDWVIVGGESGPHARPMHPDWARSLRDQCATAGVPFFFKQWGEWAPGECAPSPQTRTERVAYNWDFGSLTLRLSEEMHCDNGPDVWRFGKRAAGRLLDGIEHNGMPP